MTVTCPSCEWSADVPDEKIPTEGRKGTCPKCQTKFDVKRTEKPISEQVAIDRSRIGRDGNLNCQNCSSDNTQTVKMACLSGSTTGNSTAIGINSNLSVGVASIDSKSQTHLVSMLRPGPEPSKYGFFNVFMVLIGVFGGVVLVLMGIDNLTTFNLKKAAIGIGLGVMIFVALYKFYKMPSEKVLAWYRKNKLYEKGWICHKCGCAWIPGETPVNLSAAQNYEEMGIYTKTFIATSSFFILMGIMAFVIPPSTQSKAPNPTPSKTIPPTPPKPELVNNNLDPMAMNVKIKHPDWSDEICTAVGKGVLAKGMNPEQAAAAIEAEKGRKAELAQKPAKAEYTGPLSLSVGMDEKYLPMVKGEPDKVNVTESAYGTRKQYVYERSRGNEYVYTVNGKVTSWQSMK